MANTASIFVNQSGSGFSFTLDGTPSPQGCLSVSGLTITLTPVSGDTDYSITFVPGTGIEALDDGSSESPLVGFSPTSPPATLHCSCHYPNPATDSEFNVSFALDAQPDPQEAQVEDPTFVFKPPS